MDEPRIPPAELDLYLSTLRGAIGDVLGWLGGGIAFAGLPYEEWAGPGYAIGACFDPHVLTARLAPLTVALDAGAIAPAEGLSVGPELPSQKERLRFAVGSGRRTVRLLPRLWGGCPFRVLDAGPGWQVAATIAERPLLAVRPGLAVFATCPLRLIHRHLNQADPATTADFTDLVASAVLAAGGAPPILDDHELRRDFHALGVTVLLVAQLYRAAGRTWDGAPAVAAAREAARLHRTGDRAGAEAALGAIFATCAEARRRIVDLPIHLMVMPHGGILFPGEGFAEYDWPEASAQALNLYLDWSERFGYRFAPDIGAGTLEELARLHPATIARLRRAWDEGRCEFVNGTWSQPYLHLLTAWDHDRQFEAGLAAFTRLFGRRPAVFASQEMAIHPGLPAVLRRHGFAHAIHRSQNLGLAPIDDAALIDWQAHDGSGAIRSLPAHRLRSERRGGEVWRHLPVLLTSERARGLPFLAFTSMMDQSFIDIYTEEILRAHRFAAVWGAFITPRAFFAATADIPATPRRYAADSYRFDLDLSGNGFHGHQTGGYSSQHAFLFTGAERQRAEPDPAGLRRLLDQQAHDCYIIPYFTTGYFMAGGISDYPGPLVAAHSSRPHGGQRCIRDAAGYPRSWRDDAPFTPAEAAIDAQAMTISCGRRRVRLDPATAAVVELDGRAVRLGLPAWNGVPLRVDRAAADGRRLRLDGRIPGWGALTVAYALAEDGTLFAELDAYDQEHPWDEARICWADCVALEHDLPADGVVVRTVGGVSEATVQPRFHSLGGVELRLLGGGLRLGHGGSIFFRQQPGRLLNRLWCHDEFSTRFWWSAAGS